VRRVKVNFWRGAENCVIDALELTVRAAKSRFRALGGMWKGLKNGVKNLSFRR
jgi:hypothetical protein